MGRAKTVDVCLICDKLPCECNKKPEKKPVARTPRVAKATVDVESPLTTTPPPAPKSYARNIGILDAMKSSSIASAHEVITSAPIKDDDYEEELFACVKVLWPILHPDEHVKYADRFASHSVARRLERWKKARGSAVS